MCVWSRDPEDTHEKFRFFGATASETHRLRLPGGTKGLSMGCTVPPGGPRPGQHTCSNDADLRVREFGFRTTHDHQCTHLHFQVTVGNREMGTGISEASKRVPIFSFTTVRLRGMGTGISEASKRVPIFSFATQGGKQVSSHFRQRNWVQAREAQIRFSAG